MRDISVPLRPATGNEPVKAASSFIPLSMPTTSRGDVRSWRESPEPSTMRGATPNAASSARTTAAPAAVLPAPPKRAPRALISISDMKLSDGRFCSRSRSASGADSHALSGTAFAGVRPAPPVARTDTPRARSAVAKLRAANRAGVAWK